MGDARYPDIAGEPSRIPLQILAALLLLLSTPCTSRATSLFREGRSPQRGYAEYAAAVYAYSHAARAESRREHQIASDSYSRALEHYKRAAAMLPGSAPVAASLARVLFQLNAPQEAKTQIERAVTLAPDNILFKASAARICRSLGELEDDTRYLEAILEASPSWRQGYLTVAKSYKSAGRWASAASAYSRLRLLPGMRIVSCQNLGDLYVEIGDHHARSGAIPQQMLAYGRALLWFHRTEQLAKGIPAVILGRSRCYHGIFRFKLAIREYEKYLKVEPSDLAARCQLAETKEAVGDIQGAVAEWRQVIARGGRSQFQKPYRKLIGLLMETEDLDGATEASKRFLLAFPDEPMAHLLHGKCLYYTGELEAAMSDFRKVLELPRERPIAPAELTPNQKGTLTEAALLLGSICFETGDTQQAMHHYGKVLEIDPQQPDASNNLGYLTLENGGDPMSALRLILHAFRIRPTSGAFLDSLGWVYFKLGRTAEALPMLEEAAEVCRDPAIHYHLGEVYNVLGRLDEAQAAWRRSLDIEPGYGPSLRQLDRLQREGQSGKGR